ncbi:peptidoglycan-recognition protein LF-like [Ischnura elegans]|uniref:peptidoglycan-recognition protein LF-like n=1 Tax=Ischnura elegans TaxID=197161 RepID=UPI001ED883CF|nr:peptidoglycan-recognition protein LF-like [Ischnura elegans]
MHWPLLISGIALIISLILWKRIEIVTREEWGARPPKSMVPFENPADYVIIIHTATYTCKTKEECIQLMRVIQSFHVDSRKWPDVSYNFLVGGDGRVYEARGWDVVGDHSKGYNEVSIGIALMGIFCDERPPDFQIKTAQDLIREGVRRGKISPDYKLVGHRQISPTESPGEKLFQDLQNWDHWSPDV